MGSLGLAWAAWACLGLLGPAWAYLELSEAICNYLELSATGRKCSKGLCHLMNCSALRLRTFDAVRTPSFRSSVCPSLAHPLRRASRIYLIFLLVCGMVDGLLAILNTLALALA